MTREELKSIRESHSLTQAAFAQILGYNANYIMRLENGHENISQRFEKLVRFTFPEKKVRKTKNTP